MFLISFRVKTDCSQVPSKVPIVAFGRRERERGAHIVSIADFIILEGYKITPLFVLDTGRVGLLSVIYDGDLARVYSCALAIEASHVIVPNFVSLQISLVTKSVDKCTEWLACSDIRDRVEDRHQDWEICVASMV